MKNNILKILNCITSKNHFNGCNVNLTINYISVIPDFKRKVLNEETISEIHNILNNFAEAITSFNITFLVEKDCDYYYNNEYGEKWKSINFSFFTQSDNIDILKYGSFEIRSLGARGELDLAKHLSDPDLESKERFARIEGNNFEYDKINETIDHMIELDILLDETYDKQLEIYKKMKLLLKNG